MFRYVKLKNYKSLIDFEVDLTSKRDTPKNLILIYGENGIGKSNFAGVFHTLFETIMTRSFMVQIDSLLNSFSKEKEEDINEVKTLLSEHFSKTKPSIERIIKNCKTNDSNDSMIMEFGFKIAGKNGVYTLETDVEKVISEKLDFIYNKNITNFFSLTEKKVILNENIFTNIDYKNELLDIIEKYWGKHSLFSLLNFEKEDKKKGYLSKKLNKNLLDVLNFFMSISVRIEDGIKHRKGKVGVSNKILANLEKDSIPLKEKYKITNTEKILNQFFPNLYSDIKKMYYKTSESSSKIQYELYLKKEINNKMRDIRMSQESTGTQYLLELLPFFVNSLQKETLVIDEIDLGIHDILIKKIVENLSNSINGQVIITTHNTMLLESEINKNSLYVFVVNDEGKKELLPISDFEERFHPNLNIRKRYLSGMYGGIPFPMDIDFEDILQDLE